jgi:hypothetical protein
MHAVQQVSVFLENKTGRLADVTRTLARAGINIGALSIADTTDFGILRFLCSNPHLAASVLREAGFSVGETEVLAVQVPHHPGGLGRVLEALEPLDLNIDYLYAFRGREAEAATIVLHVENGREQEAVTTLAAAGFSLLTPEEACEM